MSNEIQLISKISAKTVCGKTEKPTKKELLYTVYGIASGLQTGETSFGTWEALTGEFEALNASDGSVYRAGRCFLPGIAHSLVAGQLKALGEDQNKAVRFALQIGVQPSDNKIGYEYTVTPVLKPTEDDAMGELRKLAAPESKPALQHHAKAK